MSQNRLFLAYFLVKIKNSSILTHPMRPIIRTIGLLAITLFIISGCKLFRSDDHVTRASVVIDETRIVKTDVASGKMFDILTAKSTGLEFLNTIPDNYEDNYWRYVFVYNGGSVNIGDFNNDGLPDIFFTGVHVPHRLFINKGELQFEDVTTKSGILKSPTDWTSGSTVADVNGDGYLDIYICNTRRDNPEERRNKLYINNGDLSFTEAGKAYGLDDASTCSTANFFDYDNDGDLDMYLVTHPMDFINKFKTVYFQKIETQQNLSNKLYRNNGDGTFTDVHLEAGINNHGFGLACSVGDVNEDGWQDIYVANDFGMYDFLYLNKGDGTFSDVSLTAIKRHDVSSMGTDIADIDNDGLLDIFNADIEMEENYTYKTFQVSSQIEIIRTLINAGYGYQKHGNSLKLNNGNGTFSEISRTAGVGVTDWAWSPFFTDFDNDGYKDLFISTGYLQDFNVDETETYSKLRRACRISDSIIYYELVNSIPRNVLDHPNFIYKNNGDLTFDDKRDEWGIYYPSVSYGAAAADFDLDGDIDIVCSNANDHPFLYRNNASSITANNYLNIQLIGYAKNTNGLGTKVRIYYGDEMQYVQHTNVRGYISTTEQLIHFGLGKNSTVERIEIEWPDGNQQILTNITANQVVSIEHKNAKKQVIPKKEKPAPIFVDNTSSGLAYEHKENEYDDFLREFLLPHKMSVLGPCIAVGDVDGNQLDDVYFGGSASQPGKLYLQTTPQKFILSPNQLPEPKLLTDNGGALFFDADNDKDNDLYITAGGNEFPANDKSYTDYLYLNDGTGKFTLQQQSIPQSYTPKSSVNACDFDADGDMDLFIGGRQYPGAYLKPVSSYILRNDKGKFTDVTAQIAPELLEIGMVTSAIWSDYNNDNKMDLVLCGDWMPFTIFENTGKLFKNISATINTEKTDGWWQSVQGSDFDNDGDIDYVLGNFGTNRRYMNTPSEVDGRNLPMEAFLSDFDNNNTQDLILCHYQHDQLYPIQLRERLLEQVPSYRKLMPSWDWYGKATVTDIFGEALNDAIHRYAYEFRSVVMHNKGNGKFDILPLPVYAQISVMMGSVIDDFNKDGFTDILMHGNYYPTDVLIMRHDAGTGLLLLGKGDCTFEAVRSNTSGYWSDGDSRALTTIACGEKNQPLIVGTINNGKTHVFSWDNGQSSYFQEDEIYALVTYQNGSVQKVESYNGSGYLSQRSRFISLTPTIRFITFVTETGKQRKVINSLSPL